MTESLRILKSVFLGIVSFLFLSLSFNTIVVRDPESPAILIIAFRSVVPVFEESLLSAVDFPTRITGRELVSEGKLLMQTGFRGSFESIACFPFWKEVNCWREWP